MPWRQAQSWQLRITWYNSCRDVLAQVQACMACFQNSLMCGRCCWAPTVSCGATQTGTNRDVGKVLPASKLGPWANCLLATHSPQNSKKSSGIPEPAMHETPQFCTHVRVISWAMPCDRTASHAEVHVPVSHHVSRADRLSESKNC